MAALAIGAGAQFPARTPAPLPAFEVVSIKPFAIPHGRGWHRTPQVDPTRLYLEGSTPEEMILWAYGLNRNQTDHMPTWAVRDFFQVTGVTAQPATLDQMRLMLQRVLAQRFQLAVTITDTVQPVDALVVAPGGLKMKPLPAGADCFHGGLSWDQIKALHLPVATLIPFNGCTVSDLVKNFNSDAGSSDQPLPVIDKTGLSGQYVMFVWERMEGCQPVTIAGRSGERCDHRESLAEAVQRELGLTLVKTTAPYRMLHIDKIEPPKPDP